jgi:hypothetical protein
MHLQLALRQPGLKRSLESFCFLLRAAVHQPIVSLPAPGEVRVCPRHPEIERVVHEKIGHDGANHSALRRTAASLNRGPIFFHHGCLAPSCDVQQHDADTLCGYIRSALEQKENGSALHRICAEHSAVQGKPIEVNSSNLKFARTHMVPAAVSFRH